MACNHSSTAGNGSSCHCSNLGSQQVQDTWVQRHLGLVIGVALAAIATALTLGHHLIA